MTAMTRITSTATFRTKNSLLLYGSPPRSRPVQKTPPFLYEMPPKTPAVQKTPLFLYGSVVERICTGDKTSDETNNETSDNAARKKPPPKGRPQAIHSKKLA